MTFLVAALPRTRTAWVANYLNYGPSRCLHDGLKECGSIADLETLLGAGKSEIRNPKSEISAVGDSDTALALFYPLWRERFIGRTKLVLLFQPVEAALANFFTFAKEHRYPGQPLPEPVSTREVFWLAQNNLLRMANEWPPEDLFILRAEQLDNAKAARELWEFCVPGAPWDFRRYEMLRAFNINVMPEKIDLDWTRCAQLHRALQAKLTGTNGENGENPSVPTSCGKESCHSEH